MGKTAGTTSNTEAPNEDAASTLLDGVTAGEELSPPSGARRPRFRRIASYWEPIHEPKCDQVFTNADWRIVQAHGAATETLVAKDLAEAIKAGVPTKFRSVAFKNCDFFGYFNEIDRALIFEGCEFTSCDFGLSTWRRAKFRNCKFQQTSLTQCTLYECEFRGCSWDDIGVSGNETRFERCYVDNPCELVDARYLNLHVEALRAGKTTRGQQIVRHWETKSTVARQLYNDLKTVGDERAFYEACRCFILCTAKHGIWSALYPGKDGDGRNRRPAILRLVASCFELVLLRTFGFLNRWGASVARPLLALIAVFVGFTFLYWLVNGVHFTGAAAKSLEITSVAGYTRGAVQGISQGGRLLEWLNLALAIICYTVFFATAVAKIARVR